MYNFSALDYFLINRVVDILGEKKLHKTRIPYVYHDINQYKEKIRNPEVELETIHNEFDMGSLTYIDFNNQTSLDIVKRFREYLKLCGGFQVETFVVSVIKESYLPYSMQVMKITCSCADDKGVIVNKSGYFIPTKDFVFMVSPFRNDYAFNLCEDYFCIPLISTDCDCLSGIPSMEELYSDAVIDSAIINGFKKYVTNAISNVFDSNSNVLKCLIDLYSESDVTEVISVNESHNSLLFEKLGVEKIKTERDITDTINNPNAYLPLIIKQEGDGNKFNTSLLISTAESDGKTVRVKETVNNATARPISEDGHYATSCDSKYILAINHNHLRLIFNLSDNMVMREGNLIDIHMLDGSICSVPLCSMFGDDNLIPEDSLRSVGIESTISANLSDMQHTINKFGIKLNNVTSKLLSPIMPIISKSKELALAAFDVVKTVLFQPLKYEKDVSLDMQEKLLNDEVDALSDKMTFFIDTSMGVAGVGILTCFNWIAMIITFFIARKRISARRIKAIQRLEYRIHDIIERLEKKIEFATQESDRVAVDQLTKERNGYKFLLVRLDDIKKNYDMDKKKTIYSDVNPDNNKDY